MSIIADTLKRLQTQSEESPPDSKAEGDARPIFNKGEGAGRHRKDSPFGFLLVMVGMTITLGGLAVAAFWIGGHLDFGLAPNTQAHVNGPLMLTNGPDLLENPVFVPQALASRVADVADAPLLPDSKALSNVEHPQKPENENTGTVIASALPQNTVVMPRPTEVRTHNVSSTQPRESASAPASPTLSHTVDQPVSGVEKLPVSSPDASEEPPPTRSAGPIATERSELAHTKIRDKDHTGEIQSPERVVLALNEEMIETEDFIKSTKPEQEAAPRPVTLAALEARQQSTHTGLPTATPAQPTQANRLRHAQKLIRSGEYEGAVALLSPLFHDPPVQWQPWFWMGTALLGNGDMEQADQFFLSGLARNDKVPQLWIQRALVAQQRGDYQLAIHELRQAETLEADLPHIHLNMGYAYEQLGNARLANQYYGKFLKLSEDQPAFYSTRKKLFARLTHQTPAEHPQPLPSSIP
ncbi:MAG: tetratricopeptide repeat protein [Nitrospirota bacterium]|nr:tetratricopeptide repeat protein [Nitrospirota bacterium]MDH5587123.1 tetratricopeptide repeat protein [Nitrospirota bacterium]